MANRVSYIPLVQSLNSPFFPPHEPGRSKRESRITCMRMLRTPPVFHPKSGENIFRSTFQIRLVARQFLHKNIPNQWNFTSSYQWHSIHFFYHNIKDNDRNLCQDLLTIENTDSDLKVHALDFANDLLVRVRLNMQKRYEKMFGKRVIGAHSLSIRVQTTINHISISFLSQYQRQKKILFLFRAREERQL